MVIGKNESHTSINIKKNSKYFRSQIFMFLTQISLSKENERAPGMAVTIQSFYFPVFYDEFIFNGRYNGHIRKFRRVRAGGGEEGR